MDRSIDYESIIHGLQPIFYIIVTLQNYDVIDITNT